MMRKNPVKEQLQQGEVVFGCMIVIFHPAVAEVLGMAGFDFVMMDGEHSALDGQALENMVRACDSAGIVAMARLPLNDPQATLPLLDTGLLGVQLPHCNTYDDAVRLVEGAKYAPLGKRGMSGGRVTAYGSIPTAEHMRQWNQELLTIVQVEETEAVENLPQMLTVPGTDIFQIGLGDLSSSMGHPGNADHPDVQKAVAAMVKQIRDSGRWAGVAPRTQNPAETKRYVDMGVQVIKYGDARLLRQSALAVLRDAKAALQ